MSIYLTLGHKSLKLGLMEWLKRLLGGSAAAPSVSAEPQAVPPEEAHEGYTKPHINLNQLPPPPEELMPSVQEAFAALEDVAVFELWHGSPALAQPGNDQARIVETKIKRGAKGSDSAYAMGFNLLCQMVEDKGGTYTQKPSPAQTANLFVQILPPPRL